MKSHETDEYSRPGLQPFLELNRNRFITVDIHPNETANITVLHGKVWATIEGDSSDYVIAAGEQILFPNAGRLVVEALESSRLSFLVIQDNDQRFHSPELAA